MMMEMTVMTMAQPLSPDSILHHAPERLCKCVCVEPVQKAFKITKGARQISFKIEPYRRNPLLYTRKISKQIIEIIKWSIKYHSNHSLSYVVFTQVIKELIKKKLGS